MEGWGLEGWGEEGGLLRWGDTVVGIGGCLD